MQTIHTNYNYIYIHYLHIYSDEQRGIREDISNTLIHLPPPSSTVSVIPLSMLMTVPPPPIPTSSIYPTVNLKIHNKSRNSPITSDVAHHHGSPEESTYNETKDIIASLTPSGLKTSKDTDSLEDDGSVRSIRILHK